MDGDHPGRWENGENRKADLKSLSAKQKNSSNFQNPNIWTDLLIVTLFVFTSKIALGLKD